MVLGVATVPVVMSRHPLLAPALHLVAADTGPRRDEGRKARTPVWWCLKRADRQIADGGASGAGPPGAAVPGTGPPEIPALPPCS
jgi:hypothetical protein